MTVPCSVPIENFVVWVEKGEDPGDLPLAVLAIDPPQSRLYALFGDSDESDRPPNWAQGYRLTTSAGSLVLIHGWSRNRCSVGQLRLVPCPLKSADRPLRRVWCGPASALLHPVRQSQQRSRGELWPGRQQTQRQQDCHRRPKQQLGCSAGDVMIVGNNLRDSSVQRSLSGKRSRPPAARANRSG